MYKEIQIICSPFGEKKHLHDVRVDEDGSVLAWDHVAKHYTRHHGLSAKMQARAREVAASAPWQKEQSFAESRHGMMAAGYHE